MRPEPMKSLLVAAAATLAPRSSSGRSSMCRGRRGATLGARQIPMGGAMSLSTYISARVRRVLAAGAIALVPLAVCAGSSHEAGAQAGPTVKAATVAGANGPMAFVRYAGRHEDDFSGQIVVRSPSGAVRQLTHFKGGAFDPKWAPDGSRIAFDRWFAQQRLPDQVYTIKADGTDARPLATGCTRAANCLGDDWPAYSPDGTQVAFVRAYTPLVKVGREQAPSAADLMLVPAAGGAPQVLRHFEGDPTPGEPAWSPDGTRLVFALTTAKQPTKQTQFLDALNVLDIASGAMTQITPLALGASDPDWSPDGRLIVFNSQAGHSPFVYLVRPDGTGLLKISRKTRIYSRIKSDPRTGVHAQFQPTWSPDGKAIAFAREPRPCGGHHINSCTRSDREQPWNLWMMRPDGTHVRRLTSGSRFEAQPNWGSSR